jgi:hypothetical protein
MELGELVNVVAGANQNDDCPFPHYERKHNKENYIPPPSSKNDAKKLSASLENESLHLAPIPLTLADGTPATAQFTAHHVVPGNETWPTSKLYKWIDKRKGHVKGDIGYDVNDFTNGIDLPGNSGASGWSGKGPGYQRDYAFACMLADTKARQFHDRHKSYSNFVIKALDKIAAKLQATDQPGCGDEDCTAGSEKPYAPPYGVLSQIDGIATRLRSYLMGFTKNWRKPLMTSRFALMLKNKASNMTQAEARKQLQSSNFKY